MRNENNELNKKNVTLNDKISNLETENVKLKETADFHYQAGIERFNENNWEEAKNEFSIVIQKYPHSNLVASAKKELLIISQKVAAEEKAKKVAEEKERRAREKEERLRGKPIEYVTFYAKAKSYSLPDKRFRFSACISKDHRCISDSDSQGKMMCGVIHAYDDKHQLEKYFTESKAGWNCGEITAAWDGRNVYIYKYEK